MAIHNKHSAKQRKTQSVPTKTKKKSRVSTLSTPIHCSARSLSQSNKTRERDKRDTNKKKSNYPCMPMFTLNTRDPKDSTQKNTLKTDKYFQQSGEIQKKHTQKFSGFLSSQWQTCQKRNKGNDPIHNSHPNNLKQTIATMKLLEEA